MHKIGKELEARMAKEIDCIEEVKEDTKKDKKKPTLQDKLKKKLKK